MKTWESWSKTENNPNSGKRLEEKKNFDTFMEKICEKL